MRGNQIESLVGSNEEVGPSISPQRDAPEYRRETEPAELSVALPGDTQLEEVRSSVVCASKQMATARAASPPACPSMLHELRNPLHAISAQVIFAVREMDAVLAGLSQSREGLSGDAVSAVEKRIQNALACLQDVSSEAKDMQTLLNDGLDRAKLSSGKVVLESLPFSLNALIRRASKGIESRCVDQSIALECNVPDEELWVKSDPIRMMQIFRNLLGNALKFANKVSWGFFGASTNAHAQSSVIRKICKRSPFCFAFYELKVYS